MNPATIALIAEFAIKFGIPAAQKLVEMFHKPNPTVEDWNALFDRATVNAKAFLEQTKDV